MKTRIIAGAVFTLVVAVTFFLAPAAVTAVTMAFMTALASYELLHTTGLVKSLRLNIYSAFMAVLVVLWSFLGGFYAPMILGVLLYLMVLFSELLLSSGKTPVAQLGYCLLSGLLIPFLLTSLLRIRTWEDGKILLLVPFIMAYCSDTGAYFIGVTMGRHKMCPNISPKKSWEGFVGGIVIAALSLMLYGLLMEKLGGYKVRYVLAAVYGLAGALGSVFGDLSMSVIKRQTGIKDYGKLIPGHGGILDRFDSVLITAPLTEALMLLIPFVE
jgi:phosphatidate cytidylyltransferase